MSEQFFRQFISDEDRIDDGIEAPDLDQSVITPTGVGEIAETGYSVGLSNVATDFEYFKGMFNTLIGDEESAAKNIENARMSEARTADAFGDLQDFGEFLDDPSLGGFVDQVVKNTSQMTPYMMTTLGSGLAGALTAGGIKATLGVGSRHVANRIVRDSLKKKVKGTATPEEERLLQTAYHLARTNSPGSRLSMTGGAKVGMYGQEFTAMSGSNFGENLDADVDPYEAALRSAGLAVPQAFIGLKGEELLTKTMFRDLGSIATKRSAKEGSAFASLAKEIAKSAGRSGVTEMAAETAQEGLSIANRFSVDKEYTAQDAMLRIGESAFAGFFGGGAMGGAGASAVGSIRGAGEIMSKARGYVEQVRQETVDNQINKEQYRTDSMGYTTAEPQSSINAQLRAATDKDTDRHSVWIAGEKPAYNAKEGENNQVEINGEVFYTRFIPGRGTIVTKNYDIAEEVANSEASDASLAIALQYGSQKPADADIAIEVLDSEGNLVWQEAANEATAAEAYKAAAKQVPKGGSIRRITLEEALENRTKLFEKESGPQVRNIDRDDIDATDNDFATEDEGPSEVAPFMSDSAQVSNIVRRNVGNQDSYKPADGKPYPETEGRRTVFARVFENLDLPEMGKGEFDAVDWDNPNFGNMSNAFLKRAIDVKLQNPDTDVFPELNDDGTYSLIQMVPAEQMQYTDSRIEQDPDAEIDSFDAAVREEQVFQDERDLELETGKPRGWIVKDRTTPTAELTVYDSVEEAREAYAKARKKAKITERDDSRFSIEREPVGDETVRGVANTEPEFVRRAIAKAAKSSYASNKPGGKKTKRNPKGWQAKKDSEKVKIDGRDVNLVDLVAEGMRMISNEERQNFLAEGRYSAMRAGFIRIAAAILETGSTLTIGGQNITLEKLNQIEAIHLKVEANNKLLDAAVEADKAGIEAAIAQEEAAITDAVLEFDLDPDDPQISGRLAQMQQMLDEYKEPKRGKSQSVNKAKAKEPLRVLMRESKAYLKEYGAFIAKRKAGDTNAKEPQKTGLLALMDLIVGFESRALNSDRPGRPIYLGKVLNTAKGLPKDARYEVTADEAYFVGPQDPNSSNVIFEGNKQEVKEFLDGQEGRTGNIDGLEGDIQPVAFMKKLRALPEVQIVRLGNRLVARGLYTLPKVDTPTEVAQVESGAGPFASSKERAADSGESRAPVGATGVARRIKVGKGPERPISPVARAHLAQINRLVTKKEGRTSVRDSIDGTTNFTINKVQWDNINKTEKRVELDREQFEADPDVGFEGEMGFSNDTVEESTLMDSEQENVFGLSNPGATASKQKIFGVSPSFATPIINVARRTLRLKKPTSIFDIDKILDDSSQSQREYNDMFASPKVAQHVREIAQDLRDNPQGGGRYIGFRDAHIILVDQSTMRSELETALTIAHEMGHALFREEQSATLLNPVMYNRLIAAWEKSRDAKGAPAVYKEEHGFEEWYADQVANWAAQEFKGQEFKGKKALIDRTPDRATKGVIASHFKAMVKKLKSFYKELSKDLKRRFAPENYSADFDGYIQEVVQTNRRNSKATAMDNRAGARTARYQAPYKAKAKVASDVAAAEKTNPNLVGAIQGAVKKMIRSKNFDPIYNLMFTSDSRLRKVGGNKIADMMYGRAQDSKGVAATRLGALKSMSLEANALVNNLEKALSIPLDSAEGRAAIDEAMGGDKTSNLSKEAQAVRKWFDDVYDNYIAPSNTDIGRQENYAPVTLKLSEVHAKPEGLVEIIAAANPEEDMKAVKAAVQRLVAYEQAVIDDKPITVKGIDPAADIEKALILTRNVGRDVLIREGYMEDSDVAILRYVNHITKRVEWNRHTKDAGGNSIFEEEFRKLNKQQQQEVKEIVDSYFGYNTKPIGPVWRTVNSVGTVVQIFAVLPFAVLGSIPELAGPVIASKEFGATMIGMKEIVNTIRDRKEAEAIARDLGLVTSASVASSLMSTTEMDWMGPNSRKLTEGFFRVIGLDAFTKLTRYFALNMGLKFIDKHSNPDTSVADSARYLKELGITDADVKAWEKGNRDYNTPEGQKVRRALQRFAESATLRPNAAERPVWASDPRFALVWQLKGFFYSYGKVLLAGSTREARARLEGVTATDAGVYGAMAGSAGIFALMGVATLPLAMVGMELREYAKFGFANVIPGIDASQKDYFRTDSLSWFEYLSAAFSRSFAAGPASIGHQMVQAADWGRGPLGSAAVAAGPTAETLHRMFTDGFSSTFTNRILPTGLL